MHHAPRRLPRPYGWAALLLITACPPAKLEPITTQSSASEVGAEPGATDASSTSFTTGEIPTEPTSSPSSTLTATMDSTSAGSVTDAGDTTMPLTSDVSASDTMEDTTGAMGTTGTTGEPPPSCPERECLVGLSPAELIDAAPVYDIGHIWGGVVAGNEDGLRVWLGEDDLWTLKTFAPTPSPVRALVAAHMQLGDADYGVAALCPEAGEMLVYQSIQGDLVLAATVPIPAGAVDVAKATLTWGSVGDLLVLDGAKAQLLPFASDGEGTFTPRPAISLQGQPVAVAGWPGDLGVDPADGILAVVSEPQGSSILIVEGKDLLPGDLGVVPVPAGPGALRVLSFSDASDYEVLVATQVGGQLTRVSSGESEWEVFNTPYDGPGGFDIGGILPEFVSLLAVVHPATGTVSLATFGNGEGASIEPPQWTAPTIAEPRHVLVIGDADVAVSSPNSGLWIHLGQFIKGN